MHFCFFTTQPLAWHTLQDTSEKYQLYFPSMLYHRNAIGLTVFLRVLHFDRCITSLTTTTTTFDSSIQLCPILLRASNWSQIFTWVPLNQCRSSYIHYTQPEKTAKPFPQDKAHLFSLYYWPSFNGSKPDIIQVFISITLVLFMGRDAWWWDRSEGDGNDCLNQ